ncbi:MAG: tRNA uridine-5-carboxymethylaminomethyl(34) synthesis GTPase MnmE [Mycoplasmoidaceae bacterium]
MNTIVALATPPIKSTIHIIRLSGPKTYSIINKISKNKIEKKDYAIQNTNLFDPSSKKVIDNVLLMKFVQPKSFTGEDMIEINCHGNMIIVDEIINLILAHGALMALPGEFTKQAFINHKLDVSQAHAINYLINAKTNFQADVSLNIVLGKSKNKIIELKDQLFNIIGNLKVNIDYPEYDDMVDINNDLIFKTINHLHHELEKIINNYKNNFHLFNTINLAIIGKPNSGKSSLLNKLLNYERSIVSDKLGTTRDYIKETINISGINFNLIDTAGIRLAKNAIEKKGIEKTTKIYEQADLILYLIDTSKKISQSELNWIKNNLKKNFLIVKNKIDLGDLNPEMKGIEISIKNNDITKLKKKIATIFKYKNEDDCFIVSNYEKDLILEIDKNILAGIDLIKEGVSPDLILSYLEHAYHLMKRFLGDDKNLDLLDELFKNFCLGK